MAVASAEKILSDVQSGKRLQTDDAVRLYREADLHALGQAAQDARFRKVPGRRVTYLIDRNINYTNICITDCQFCAFYRPNKNHPESYVLTRAELSQKIEELMEVGGTRILMQGGHNPDLPIAWYEDLLRWLRATYPEIEINAFSPSEIDHIATLEGLTMDQVLGRLKAAGLAGLPGGGAEMLDDEVRKRVSPKKQNAAGWLEAMRAAQRHGLVTSASQVIGFAETLEQRIGHLQKLRDLQHESRAAHGHGFSAFIAWSLQTENTPLGRSKNRDAFGASANEYLRHMAIARLFLDNFDHIQPSWPTQGLRLAEVALEFGCDDFGSTMLEENVVSAAGTSLRHVAELTLQKHIRGAGYTPAQRDSRYNILRVVEQVPSLAAPRRAVA